MLGFAVFSTLGATATYSSTPQIIDLDGDEVTAEATGVVEPIRTTLMMPH